MRHALSFFAPLAGSLVAAACTTNVMVGSDGQGGGTTTTHTTSSGGNTTTSSSTTTSTTSGASCWDGTPVSNEGGPCGGNLWTNPPTCANGLVCQQTGLPDSVGTCAPSD